MLLLSVFVITGFFIIGFNYENSSVEAQRVFHTYENEIYGIEIKYPANWEIIEDYSATYETGAYLFELHPLGENKPVIHLKVHFLSPENATLQSFTEQQLKSIQALPSWSKKTTKNIVSQNSSVTLGGYPAHKVVYETITSQLENQ